MDKSRAKAIVRANLGPLQRAFGIPHWKIVVDFDLTSEADDGDRFVTMGRCLSRPAYDQASIRLNPADIEDEAHLLKVLRHELEHVVLAPFDLYRAHATRGVKADSKEEREHDHLWEYVVEQGVINLERVWQGALEYASRKAKPKPKRRRK